MKSLHLSILVRLATGPPDILGTRQHTLTRGKPQTKEGVRKRVK